MFEITRHSPFSTRPVSDLMSWIANEPFLRGNTFSSDEGTLPLDISEVESEIVVRASLPGFNRDDIDVQIHKGVLSIKAERTEENESKDEKFYYKERRFGSVSRRVALPGMVSDAEAKAELKDGVLTLRIPQGEGARPKRIAIK